MSKSEIFHIIFYFSGIVSLMVGSFGLSLNPKNRLNRTFFALCCSVSIWAGGFSMAIDAPTLAMCLFWRRISALGWGSMFCILLHFCLAYSQQSHFLKKSWFYLLLYTPAVICIFVFAVYNPTVTQQYHFVRTSMGWTNDTSNNLWDWFFTLYYVSYMVLGLVAVSAYAKKSNSAKIKRQVKLLIISFFTAFLLGTATDNLCNALLSVKIPQIAPIIILAPIISVYYSILKYGFMQPNQVRETEDILTKSTRAKVYAYLSIALLTGSIVNYFVQYLYYEDFLRPLPSSLFILIAGILVQITKSIEISEYVKDIILVIIIFITIPSVTLIFIPYGSITVWAIAFLFLLIAMVFSRPIVLWTISISAISTQILVWTLKPEAGIVVDRVDYLGRIGILCITIWIAYYVNQIYISRLKQNAEQLGLQQFISEVSSDFINVDQSNLKQKMDWVIRIVGKLFSIDRINILFVDLLGGTVEYSNVWDADGLKRDEYFVDAAPEENIDWLMEQLVSNELIFISNVNELPAAASGIKTKMKERNVHSFAAIPILEKKDSIIILEFSAVSSSKKWTGEELKALNIIANIFNDAYLKVDAEQEISFMAYHDHLTGLPNRRLLRDRMNQAIAVAKRTERMLGIIFIDLDSFKTINDTVGHEGGDALLKIVSEKLSKAVRISDTVTRFGGDEFLIMLNDISKDEDIIHITDKIIERLSKPLTILGQEFNLTISVGISVYPFDGTDMDSLIRNADIAMYKAKENGKNQFVICSSELKNEVIHKIKITNSLHRAIRQNEFHLHYQPQVQLATGRIVGVEALIRWNHPEMGWIPPMVFIPIAEQIGVIGEIGEWVLKNALLQNKKWQDSGYPAVCMAVNVSANQLRNVNFIDIINDTLDTYDIDPHYVEIEITESAAMNEFGDIIEFLNKIRELGIMIAIDDFGTDYSSLSRLKELPIDRIKIDKQFVDGILVSEKDKAIVRTIINLAKNLDLKVIAEGVETDGQLEFLNQEACDEVQGYYYYKPMPAEDLERIFQEQAASE